MKKAKTQENQTIPSMAVSWASQTTEPRRPTLRLTAAAKIRGGRLETLNPVNVGKILELRTSRAAETGEKAARGEEEMVLRERQ